MARVELENVSKVYPGGYRAVRGVDLDIADREFVVLVGPSGCGKTTILRMVAGLEEISDGVVRIGDRVVNGVPPKSRDIAMVFQNYALYPHMTVYKNMAFGLKLRGMPKKQIHERVTQAARILEIEHLLDRKPKALSGGQRQRVAVGRAIVREPAAFLFDEPLSNLDAKLRVSTRAELKRLHQRLKTTTIYVTHDQEEAMTLGDRIVVVKDGKIQQADTPLNTYNLPANRFVAGFIGTPPMNFFDGMVKATNGSLSFVEGRLANARADGVAAAPPPTPSEEADKPVVMVGELTMPPGGFTLPIPARLRERLAPMVGKHVVLGVRPEHLGLRPQGGSQGTVDGGDQPARIDVLVNVVEPLGNNMDVYMSSSLHDRVVGRLEAQAGLSANTPAALYVDLRKVHFFEPGETGMNLSLENTTVNRENSHAIH